MGLPTNAKAKIDPSIDGTIFAVYARKDTGKTGYNVLIKIDLTTGKVISQDILSSVELYGG